MEILFLGTGAADWDINNKGDFFRRNSSSLIDGKLLIDCTEHVFDFKQEMNMPTLFDEITDLIITHNHSDHFTPNAVLQMAEKKKIRVGCCKEIMNKIGKNENIEYVVFEPFKKYSMGGYEITPLLANHHVVTNGADMAFHYIIETPDEKTVFYGLDGAWFLRPSWEMMKNFKFDMMIFDCTVGESDDWRIFEHNTIPMLRMMIKEIKNQNMLAENGIMIASHLARTLHKSHEETADVLRQSDVLTAFDAMAIEV